MICKWGRACDEWAMSEDVLPLLHQHQLVRPRVHKPAERVGGDSAAIGIARAPSCFPLEFVFRFS
jgi:hypothetical protein